MGPYEDVRDARDELEELTEDYEEWKTEQAANIVKNF